LGETGGCHPGVETGLVTPAGDHQPRRAIIGGLEEFETLEAVVPVH
jgi:hypothetical protein